MRNLERDEQGFTLVELLVATAIALVLIGVTVALITSTLKSEPRASSRSSQIEAGRVMLERITRELREGCKVSQDGTDGRNLKVFMDCESETAAFEYACGTDECHRTDVAAGTSQLMVGGLEAEDEGAPWPVFIVDNTNYVEIQLRFPRAETAGESVTLSDGVAMRNQSVATEE